MNILFDARPLAIPHPGGVTRVTHAMLTALAALDARHTITLATTGSHKPNLASFTSAKTQHVHLGYPNKLISATTSLGISSLDRLFARTQPDLLLLPNLGHVGRPRIPYGLVVHDLSFLVEPQWFHGRGRAWHHFVHAERLITEATRVFAVSAWTKQALTLHLDIPADRIDVLPLAIHPLGSVGELPISLKQNRFALCLGSTYRNKNVRTAIRALTEVRKHPAFQDVELVVVGEPISPKPDWIHLFPHVDDRLLCALYAHAAVFLYPTWYEGFGLPLHEASVFGTPCISSCTSSLPETSPPGVLFAPPSKPHLWIAAIEYALTMPRPNPLASPPAAVNNRSAQHPVLAFIQTH